jgi:hypothetical protein
MISATMRLPRLAESTASDQTIMAIAGHVSPKMLAHYSHVRLERKRKVLDTLSSEPEAAVTSQRTSQIQAPVQQLLENMVDVAGIEPATPCLQRLRARRINNLDRVLASATNCYSL